MTLCLQKTVSPISAFTEVTIGKVQTLDWTTGMGYWTGTFWFLRLQDTQQLSNKFFVIDAGLGVVV